MSSDIETATAQLLAIHSSTGSRVLRHLITLYRSLHDREHNRPEATVRALEDVERILDYEFWDITLLEEAFTKVKSADDVPCYDRLEYLGDAVLDLNSADFWVRRGEAPSTASASVNNEVLQALCLELGLDQYIRNTLAKDRKEITRTKNEMAKNKNY
ncbi:Endoribonuclease Dicer [Mortierella sp. NVP85]|nr:Endoribonuclease Dicer [Mortierella sp. NVP85]